VERREEGVEDTAAGMRIAARQRAQIKY